LVPVVLVGSDLLAQQEKQTARPEAIRQFSTQDHQLQVPLVVTEEREAAAITSHPLEALALVERQRVSILRLEVAHLAATAVLPRGAWVVEAVAPLAQVETDKATPAHQHKVARAQLFPSREALRLLVAVAMAVPIGPTRPMVQMLPPQRAMAVAARALALPAQISEMVDLAAVV
jgi:hypothetical protein